MVHNTAAGIFNDDRTFANLSVASINDSHLCRLRLTIIAQLCNVYDELFPRKIGTTRRHELLATLQPCHRRPLMVKWNTRTPASVQTGKRMPIGHSPRPHATYIAASIIISSFRKCQVEFVYTDCTDTVTLTRCSFKIN